MPCVNVKFNAVEHTVVMQSAIIDSKCQQSGVKRNQSAAEKELAQLGLNKKNLWHKLISLCHYL